MALETPDQHGDFTATRWRVSTLRTFLIRNCVGGMRYASAPAGGVDFQACSIDYADISPLWNQPVADGLEQCRAKMLLQIVRCSGGIRIGRLQTVARREI